jgi:hypothetical protein
MPYREYTAKAYTVIQSKLTKKASSLGGSWTAESVGKVIWIVSILSANGSGPGTLIPEPAPVTTTSLSKISKTENEEESGVINENKKKKISDKNDDHVTLDGNEEDNQDTKISSKRKRK